MSGRNESESSLRASRLFPSTPESIEIIGNNTLSTQLVISPMLPCHVPAVARMEGESHPNPWSREAFLEELTLPQSRTFVALEKTPAPKRVHRGSPPFCPLSTSPGLFFEQIVGYLCFWCVVDELQILNVTVAASHRRKGIGRRLLHHALNYGVQKGARMAVLEVRKTNRAAQGLYEEAGFRTVGERPGYYSSGQEPALLMHRDLDENSMFPEGHTLQEEDDTHVRHT